MAAFDLMEAVRKAYGIDTSIQTHQSAVDAHPNATLTLSGFMSAQDKTKLDGISSNANNYVHPTADGSLHVPATGTTSDGKVLKAGQTQGSLQWGTLTQQDVGAINKTTDTMTGTLTVGNLSISGQQGTGQGNAVRYDYLNQQTPARYVDIPADQDLNTYQTPGFYLQGQSAEALISLNYPEQIAGSLSVYQTGTASVVQYYISYVTAQSRKIYWRNYYSNVWSPWTTIYDTNFKPTAAEVGALSTTGGSISGEILFTGKGLSTGLRFLPNGANDAFGIRCNNPDGNTGELEFYSTDDDVEPFVFRHYTTGVDGSGTSVEWVRIDNGGLKVKGNLVYHPGNKPTAADVGAVNKTGDTMTGHLKLTSTAAVEILSGTGNSGARLSGEGGYAIMRRMPTPEDGVRAADHIAVWANATTPGRLYFRRARADQTTAYDDYQVYHEGFRPTPSGIGAVNRAGDIMTGNLDIDGGADFTSVKLETRSDDMALVRVSSKAGKTMGVFGSQAGADGLAVRTVISVYDKTTGDYIGDAFRYSHTDDTSDIRRPISSSDQGTAANALTRKDWVDANFVNKAGGTMTGGLNIANKLQVGSSADGSFGGGGNDLLGRMELVAPSDPNHLQKTGITFHHKSSSTGKISYNQVDAGTSYLEFTSDDPTFDVRVKGNKIYHQGFKPTAADVGALQAGATAVAATKLATARTIAGVAFDGTANINLPGVDIAGNQSTTGNAATATKLATARTLTVGGTGKAFDGAGNVSWSLPEIGAARSAGEVSSGAAASISTATFVQWLESIGAFNDKSWTARCSWSYAANRTITDTGCGNIHLAGCTIEVISTSTSTYTIRVITPTTTSYGGTTGAEFVYVNNGPDYSPGWRRIYTTSNKPTASDVGALSIAGGEMGGAVTFRGSANLLNVVDGAKIRYFNGGSTWFYTSVNAAGEFEVSTGAGETSIATIDYSGKIRTSNQGVLYGDRSKPTASDVGAAPAGFGLGEYGRAFGSVLGDTSLRRQSGFFQGQNIEGLPTSPHPWNYVFNQAHGNAAGFFGYLAISFDCSKAWIGGQTGGVQKGPFELVKWGDRYVAHNAVGNDFNQCAIEVNGNTAIDSRPGIGFHMSNRFASTLHLWEAGDFRFHTQGLGSYAGIMTGNVNANDVYIRSDIRLKRNLVRVTGALDKTCSLTAYSYDKKQTLKSTDYDKHEVGLIAQDVEKVLPAAISYIEDSDAETGATTLMISNSAVTALLVEAIKELTDRVKYLESKIN